MTLLKLFLVFLNQIKTIMYARRSTVKSFFPHIPVQSKFMEQNLVTQFGRYEIFPDVYHYVSDLQLMQLNEKVAQDFGSNAMFKLKDQTTPRIDRFNSELSSDQIFQTIPSRYRNTFTDVWQDLAVESQRFQNMKDSVYDLIKKDLDNRADYRDLVNSIKSSSKNDN
ncbi:hypothetical protein [Dipodfec virus UA06Rod_3]|uniref:Uncharacterized protein n=1 Tax=Dipodfec virus UA06Rod_3 TaxID=2929323 RepID=A0A976N1D6_9VIRU|nr:hypothetical protein [Dipodfec virus UA06Rod_3]